MPQHSRYIYTPTMTWPVRLGCVTLALIALLCLTALVLT